MARIQGKTTSEDFLYFAGIDVSKAHLDLHVHGSGRGRRFANDPAGIAALLEALKAPHLVVFEPTGRYHLALWRALAAAGHGAVPFNPHRARLLACGLGQRAKTDPLDALVLSEIAARLRPETRPAPTDLSMEIKELHSAYRAVTKRRAMVRMQRSASGNAQVIDLLTAEDAFLTAQIKALAEALKALFLAQSHTRRLHEILTSIPGFADGAAAAIIAGLPEIGALTGGEIAALSGTAPIDRQSGQHKGQARSGGGRRDLRTALHLPAIVAMTHNPDLKAFATRLKTRGKHNQTIITAVLRKLLILANALVAQNRTWTQTKP